MNSHNLTPLHSQKFLKLCQYTIVPAQIIKQFQAEETKRVFLFMELLNRHTIYHGMKHGDIALTASQNLGVPFTIEDVEHVKAILRTQKKSIYDAINISTHLDDYEDSEDPHNDGDESITEQNQDKTAQDTDQADKEEE